MRHNHPPVFASLCTVILPVTTPAVVLGTSSSSHACAESTIPTEPFPQSLVFKIVHMVAFNSVYL